MQVGDPVLVDFRDWPSPHALALAIWPDRSAVPGHILRIGRDGRVHVQIGGGHAPRRFDVWLPEERVRPA